MAIPETIGIGILSSTGLYASVIAPHKAPKNAGSSETWVKAPINDTTKNANVPTYVFLLLNGIRVLPNLFPNIVDAESPNKRIIMAAFAIMILNLNKYKVIIIPIKKYINPLSSSSRLQFLKMNEKKGTFLFLSILKIASTKSTIAIQRSIVIMGLKNQFRKTMKIPDA